MIKKTLKLTLCALLLGAGVTALADGPIQLGNGTSVSWEDFAKVINGETSPTIQGTDTWNAYESALAAQKTAQDSVTNRQKELDAWAKRYKAANDSLNNMIASASRYEPKTETVNLKYSDATWFKNQKTAFDTFKADYDAANKNKSFIWYYLPESGRNLTLYLSFLDPAGATPPVSGASYTEVSEDFFYTNVITKTEVKFSAVKVFLGYKEGSTTEYNYTVGSNGLYTVPSWTSSTDREDLINIIESGLESLGEMTTGTQTVQTSGYKELLDDIDDKTLWRDQLAKEQEGVAEKLAEFQTALDTANADVAAKKAQVENLEAEAASAYQNVTLTSNVDATTAITATDYKGTIDGNGNVINVPTGSLFKKFTGQLSNAAINGSFASSFVGATFDNVAVNNGSTYRFYDDQGAPNNAITSLGMLGFVARNYFGVDFTNNKLAKKAESTIVYDITVYEPNKTTQNYVVKNGTSLTGKGGAAVTIPANMFAKSATADLKGINNVYYVDGGANVCDNVVIADKASFYCPVDITATALTLNRTFKGGKMNSVCLPFALKKTEDMTALCTYDRETKAGFVFTYEEDEVPANTPMLLQPTKDMVLELQNVQLKQTNSTQITDATGNFLSESACYGTFKQIGAGGFAGGSTANGVYGLNGDNFQVAGTDAKFAPFRIGIVSYTAPTNAPRRIIIKNMEGTDITDTVMGGTSGVKDAVAEAPAFNVAGGQGEIVITSDVDYGKVVVYNAEGKAVDAANVVAGTTTINVQKGLYIVMGKKVMVK